ncbi:MAG: hypothetical protein Tp1100DCM51572_16 [Prokaryotic dsDNA virus sp.]|nr:MAG: hypothetical protein Tp1100DCM51572_16 [Prokaryotic dsDNA virus sp.]
MANETLEQILTVEAATGPFGQADAVLEQTLRDFIQLQSTLISVGTKVVGVRRVGWLEFTWYTGQDGTFAYPLADNAVTDPTKIGTSNYSVHLRKGQGRCVFLDSTLLRGESWENIDRQQLAIIRNMADVIDDLILDALIAGADQTVAVSGGSEWDTASADAEANILAAMDKIFENGRVSGNEPLALIVPAKHRNVLLNTTLYGNVVESLAEHLGRIGNLTIYYTRNAGFADTAVLMVPGAETGEFFQYNGDGFQETELTRIPGVGYDWMLTGYMGCVIHEDGGTAGKNSRICTITNISA